MALVVGSRLGHYSVTALIGEGGMGQVYQATDTKLNRQVALKILPEASHERAPRFSPDGRWLAYVSDESGRDEVYVRPYPGPGERMTISTEGGTEPAWSRSGHRLFYRLETRMMAAPVELGARLVAGTPELVFEGPFDFDNEDGANANYDVTLDGEEFVMVRGAAGSPAQLVLAQNWFAEIERLVPRE